MREALQQPSTGRIRRAVAAPHGPRPRSRPHRTARQARAWSRRSGLRPRRHGAARPTSCRRARGLSRVDCETEHGGVRCRPPAAGPADGRMRYERSMRGSGGSGAGAAASKGASGDRRAGASDVLPAPPRPVKCSVPDHQGPPHRGGLSSPVGVHRRLPHHQGRPSLAVTTVAVDEVQTGSQGDVSCLDAAAGSRRQVRLPRRLERVPLRLHPDPLRVADHRGRPRYRLSSQDVKLWNQVSAASIVFSPPPVLLIQRQSIGGLRAGAVKGKGRRGRGRRRSGSGRLVGDAAGWEATTGGNRLRNLDRR